ncbi:MAG TPA: sulfotransferase [Candidatus Saccharimonadia bacterium]|nr:sulfotransferase [Candidatus Saccharimonadia bacterium]
MNQPRIAFCSTCKGRTYHIVQTLTKNIADNADYTNAVFIILDYDSQDGLDDYLRTQHANDIANGRLVVYSHRNGGAPFHVSHAKNIAARCGILEGADILVTLDADNFTGPGFAHFVIDKLSEPKVLPGVFLVPDHLFIQSLPHGPLRPNRGFAGRLAIWARDFIKAGGYDEMYNTWRGEDIDMNFRLERMGYTRRFIDNSYLGTIPHNAEVRFKEYPHARQYENIGEVKIIRARTETVVNHGNFGIGTVYRNFNRTPIELGHIPTRVFGIGLHRTGTTSLHEAFKKIGFDSFHWGVGEAPLIWHEMNGLGRSKTLEQWYALSDLPIPLFYKKLDEVYKGSKFILTIRDEVDWLQSVKRLWDYKHNPSRYIWDVYPFSNQIHTVLYGQKDFDALIFLERYRRHNAEVKEYFKDRPEDLLVMNMDAGGGWPALCMFLKLPVPSIPYPRMNRSNDISVSEISVRT